MNKAKYLAVIENLGLSKNEASVYLAAFSLGTTTVMKLSEVSGLERTNIYRIIKSLEKKGIFSTEVDGLKKQYKAEDPSQLEVVLESKKDDFLEILPDLKDMYGKSVGSSEIKYFKGVNGIKAVYQQLIDEIKISDFYYVMSDLDKWHDIDPDYFDKFIKKRIKMGVRVKFLAQDGEKARYNKQYEGNFLQEVRILPEGTTLKTDTIVTPNRVIIIQFDDPITTFVIENKNLIQTHKEYFEIMWNSIRQNPATKRD